MALGRLALTVGSAGAGLWAGWLVCGRPSPGPRAPGWLGGGAAAAGAPVSGGLAALMAGAAVVAVMNGYSKAYSP